MPFKTALMIHPTLEEVKREATVIKLPTFEAEEFFFYYQSNGWKVGKNPMKCWKSALQGWRIRWLKRKMQYTPKSELPQVDDKTQTLLRDIKANKP